MNILRPLFRRRSLVTSAVAVTATALLVILTVPSVAIAGPTTTVSGSVGAEGQLYVHPGPPTFQCRPGSVATRYTVIRADFAEASPDGVSVTVKEADFRANAALFTDFDPAAPTSNCLGVMSNIPPGSNYQIFPPAPSGRSLFIVVAGEAPDQHGTFQVTVSSSSGIPPRLVTLPIPVDTVAPSLNLPTTVAAEATGPDGAPVSYTTSSLDAQTGVRAVTCAADSGSIFPIGLTPVQCQSSDGNGNTATGTFFVLVRDTTPPAPIQLSRVSVEATGPGGRVVDFRTVTYDVVDGQVPVLCSPPLPRLFPLGDTVLACAATDAAGNVRNGAITVRVEDTTPPSLRLPANLTLQATSAAGTTVSFDATAVDTVAGARPVSCSAAVGSTFALGATTVACTSSDGNGNTSTGSFTVTVVDTEGPVLTLPDDIVVEATTPEGTVVSFVADAVDAVTAATVECSPASGSTFAIGATTVTCGASDAGGNTSTGTFLVVVRDTTQPGPPVISKPQAGLVTSTNTPTITGVAEPSSMVRVLDGETIVCLSSANGTGAFSCTLSSALADGSHTLSAQAVDAFGNVGPRSPERILIVDTTPPGAPTVTKPSDGLVTNDSTPELSGRTEAGSTVSVRVGETTVCEVSDATTDWSCVSELLPDGQHTLTVTATDAAGNVSPPSTHSFTIDTVAPQVVVPDNITGEATGADGRTVDYVATASDALDGAIAASCQPGPASVFPIGESTVTCTATDAAGNIGAAEFVVTVVDTTGPQITHPADVAAESTSPAGAVVEYEATATDLVDGTVPVTCVPASGTVFPAGTTRVTCTASDLASGNASTATFSVDVSPFVPPVPPASPVPPVEPAATSVDRTLPQTGAPAGDSAGAAAALLASGAALVLLHRRRRARAPR